MSNKRYFWLKLHEDFFKSLEMKKLRSIAGGDTFTIIYLKMQLLSLSNDGLLFYESIEDTFSEEIALSIDENVDNVRLTIAFMEKHNLIEQIEEDSYLVPLAKNNMESIAASSIRSQKSRDVKKALKALQCNTIATKCNTDIEKEKDIDKEIEIKKETVFSDEVISLASRLIELLQFNNPKVRIPSNLSTWHNAIRLLIERDGHSKDEVLRMIEFSQTDNFWKSNILSATKLREKKDTLLLQSQRNMTPMDRLRQIAEGETNEQTGSSTTDFFNGW